MLLAVVAGVDILFAVSFVVVAVLVVGVVLESEVDVLLSELLLQAANMPQRAKQETTKFIFFMIDDFKLEPLKIYASKIGLVQPVFCNRKGKQLRLL